MPAGQGAQPGLRPLLCTGLGDFEAAGLCSGKTLLTNAMFFNRMGRRGNAGGKSPRQTDTRIIQGLYPAAIFSNILLERDFNQGEGKKMEGQEYKKSYFLHSPVPQRVFIYVCLGFPAQFQLSHQPDTACQEGGQKGRCCAGLQGQQLLHHQENHNCPLSSPATKAPERKCCNKTTTNTLMEI